MKKFQKSISALLSIASMFILSSTAAFAAESPDNTHLVYLSCGTAICCYQVSDGETLPAGSIGNMNYTALGDGSIVTEDTQIYKDYCLSATVSNSIEVTFMSDAICVVMVEPGSMVQPPFDVIWVNAETNEPVDFSQPVFEDLDVYAVMLGEPPIADDFALVCDDSITRGDVCVIYWKLCGCPEILQNKISLFADYEDIPEYQHDAVAWCIQEGIMRGTSNKELQINRPINNDEYDLMYARYNYVCRNMIKAGTLR